jgi:hypothetical protein
MKIHRDRKEQACLNFDLTTHIVEREGGKGNHVYEPVSSSSYDYCVDRLQGTALIAPLAHTFLLDKQSCTLIDSESTTDIH